MAEDEAVEAPADGVDVPASTGDEPAPPTTSLKERIKRPAKPEETELKLQTGSLNDEIQKAKSRIEQIKEEIASKTSNRQKGSDEQQRVKSALSELRGQFQSELGKKQKIRAELDTHRAARDALVKQQREMRTKCEYMSVDQVDSAIAKLENRMAHTSLSLNEEKKAMEDIKRLRASRATVAQHNQRMERLNAEANGNSRSDIVERLKETDQRLNDIKTQEDGLRAELSAVVEKDRQRGSDIPVLIKERDEMREIVDQAYSKIKELRSEHREKVNQWREQENLWHEQRREDQQRRREQEQKEWQERQAERKRRDAEMAGDPFHQQVTTCEQLHAYLSKFKSAEAAASAPLAQASVDIPEGFKAMKKKGTDEELDGFFGGLAGSKGGKKGKKGRAAEKGTAKPIDQRLTHSLDMINAFASLKVETPLFSSNVPEAIDAIQGRKDYFLEKRRKVKAEEPVEDADWEKPAAAAGSSSSTSATANGVGTSRSHSAGPSSSRQDNGFADIHDWPAIAGSHQIVEEEIEAPAKPALPPPSTAVAVDGPAKAVATGPSHAEASAAAASVAHAGHIAADLEPAPSGISVALTVGDEDDVAVALTIDPAATA